MATALTIINDAFNDLEIKSAEVDLTDSEINTGIRYLNRLMVTLAADGFNVGYTKVVTKDDETDIPDWFEDAVITTLAIRLAPGFGITLRPSIAVAASELIVAARKRIVHLHKPLYPNSLPIGSGNYQGDNSKYFLDESEGDLLSGNNQTLSDDESIILSKD